MLVTKLSLPKTLSIATSLLIASSNAFGAGFALQEQSVAGLGNSFAGAAASAEDASTVFFNPAGMSFLEGTTITGGFHYISPNVSFENQGTTTLNRPTQGGNSISDEAALVPNFSYVTSLNDKWNFGLGFSAPYGLTTEYSPDWVGRYVAIKSSLKTINLNPSLSFAPNDKWSFGAGFNIAYLEAELSNAVDFGLVYLNQFQSGVIPANPTTIAIAGQTAAALGTDTFDGNFDVQGDDIAYGWNLGAIYSLSNKTRIGFHYRSSLESTLEGNVEFQTGALEPFFGDIFKNQGGSVDIKLPQTYSLSLYHQTDGKWAFLADATKTYWSSFQTLTIQYETPTPPSTVIPEEWENSSKYSVGANYQATTNTKLRFGAALDQSPVPNNSLRSPRIPDEDRVWLSAGVSHKMSDTWQFDISYLHVLVDDPIIDNDTHSAGQHLRGKIDASVDVLSLGFSYRH